MRLTARCFAVPGLGFTPPWEVNAGFVVGERTTLVVDTGPSWLAGQTVHGYASAVRPGNALLAVNTEPHVDHLLGNAWFAERGVPIWGHPACRREAGALGDNVREFDATIPDPARRGEGAVFFGGSRIVNPEPRIEAPAEVDLGGVVAALLPAPGHTPANLLVHVAAEGVLYAGDTVVAGYAPNLEAGEPDAWRQWLEALAVVRRLAPRIVVPGHGPVLEGAGIEREVARVEACLRERLGRRAQGP